MQRGRPADKLDKVKVLKKIFEKDIEQFAKFFFKHHLILDTPKFHRELYQLLEEGGKRIAIAAPRGHAKTTIVDLVYISWLIVHKRSKFILLLSDTYSQSTMFMESLKSEFEANERLKAFYGDMKTEKWAEDSMIANDTMVKALGANMKVRGLKYKSFRPDLIICDDLENDEMVESKERREKLSRWFNGALIPSLAPNGKVIIIGTILHYDSLLNNLIDKNRYPEWNKKIYRAIMNGQALWPEHLNLHQLEEIKQSYVREGQGYLFYQEYMNDPVSDEFRKFKIEKIKFYEQNEVEGKQMNVYMAIDRAYSMNKTSDFTGIIVAGVDSDNRWYILHAERFKGMEKELIEKIFDLKRFFSPLKVGIEQRSYVYTLKPTLDEEMMRRNSFFKIEELKDLGKSKALRIEALLPRYEANGIFFKKGQEELIDELITFPRGTHDDLIDALAYITTLATVPYNPSKIDPYYAAYGTAYRARRK
jgi:predicted phage terminase large subunit-like protein